MRVTRPDHFARFKKLTVFWYLDLAGHLAEYADVLGRGGRERMFTVMRAYADTLCNDRVLPSFSEALHVLNPKQLATNDSLHCHASEVEVQGNFSLLAETFLVLSLSNIYIGGRSIRMEKERTLTAIFQTLAYQRGTDRIQAVDTTRLVHSLLDVVFGAFSNVFAIFPSLVRPTVIVQACKPQVDAMLNEAGLLPLTLLKFDELFEEQGGRPVYIGDQSVQRKLNELEAHSNEHADGELTDAHVQRERSAFLNALSLTRMRTVCNNAIALVKAYARGQASNPDGVKKAIEVLAITREEFVTKTKAKLLASTIVETGLTVITRTAVRVARVHLERLGISWQIMVDRCGSIERRVIDDQLADHGPPSQREMQLAILLKVTALVRNTILRKLSDEQMITRFCELLYASMRDDARLVMRLFEVQGPTQAIERLRAIFNLLE